MSSKEHQPKFIKGPFNNEMALGIAASVIESMIIVDKEFEKSGPVVPFSIAFAEISINGVWYQIKLDFDPKKSNEQPYGKIIRK